MVAYYAVRHRYAITHCATPGGVRRLSLTNESRNHFDTRAGADWALVHYAPSLVATGTILPGQYASLEVTEIECDDDRRSTRGILYDPRGVEASSVRPARSWRCSALPDLIAAIL